MVSRKNVLATLNQQLPDRWEAKLTENGRIYYINHQFETTSWTPPVENWDTSSGLPYGYESAIDKDGKPYFINHTQSSTTREDPRQDPDYVQPPKPRAVELVRDPDKGFGFVAGSEKPVVVRFVTDDGPSINKLMAGDQIIAINGEDVKRAPREYVIDLVRSCQESISITVCQPYYDNGGRKSALLTAAKKARLKSNPSRVRFAEAVTVNGSPIQSPASHESYIPFMPNVLKVFLENGQTRSFKYDNKTSVQDVLDSLQEKLGVTCMEYFALVLQNTRDSPHKVSILLPSDTLQEIAGRPNARHFKCLFRLTFVPKDAYDLLRKDAQAFEYFYMQCCNDVVQERFASELKYDTALKLSALHIQQHAMMNNMTGKISIKSLAKECGLEKFVPKSLMLNLKLKDLRKMLAHFLKSNQGLTAPGQKQLTALQAKLHYLKIVGEVRLFGGKIFLGTLEKKSEVMIAVGPKTGISHVTNIKTHTQNLLMDFESLDKIVLKKDTHNCLMVQLYAVNGKSVCLSLIAEDVPDFTALIEGYYHIMVNHNKQLVVDESSPNAGVPSYYGKHKVVTSSWTYPDDLVSVIEDSQENETSDNERVVDFSHGPPPYEGDGQYIAKIKEDLGLQPPIPEEDYDDRESDLEDEEDDGDDYNRTDALDLLVQSFASSADEENGEETDDELEESNEGDECELEESNEGEDGHMTAPHDVYMGHDDEKFNTRVENDEQYDEEYCAKFKNMIAKRARHQEGDWVMGLDNEATTVKPEKHIVLEHAKDSIAMRKRSKRGSLILTVGFESDEFSGSSPERSETSTPPAEINTSPPLLFKNPEEDGATSFGLHSPTAIPRDEQVFFGEDVCVDPDIIDLTFLPPPEFTSDESLLAFTIPSTNAPPPGFSDNSDNSTNESTDTIFLPNEIEGASSSAVFVAPHEVLEDREEVPVSMIDLPSPLYSEKMKQGDEELGAQMAAIDALSVGDDDKHEVERESGIESESDSGNETVSSENVDYQRGAGSPYSGRVEFSYASAGRSKLVDSKPDDVQRMINKFSVPPPPLVDNGVVNAPPPPMFESTESTPTNEREIEADVVSALTSDSITPVNESATECQAELLPPLPDLTALDVLNCANPSEDEVDNTQVYNDVLPPPVFESESANESESSGETVFQAPDNFIQKVLSDSLSTTDNIQNSQHFGSLPRPKRPPPLPPPRRSSLSDEILVQKVVTPVGNLTPTNEGPVTLSVSSFSSSDQSSANSSPKRSKSKDSDGTKRKSWYSALSLGRSKSKSSYDFGVAQEEFETNFDVEKVETPAKEEEGERRGRDRTIKKSESLRSPDKSRMSGAKEAFSKFLNLASRRRTGSLDRSSSKSKSDGALVNSRSKSMERGLDTNEKSDSGTKVSRARSFHIPTPKFLRGRSPTRSKEPVSSPSHYDDRLISQPVVHTSADIHGTFPRFRSKNKDSPLSSHKRMTFDLNNFAQTGQIADAYERANSDNEPDQIAEDVALTGPRDNHVATKKHPDSAVFQTFGKHEDDTGVTSKVQRHASLGSKDGSPVHVRHRPVQITGSVSGVASASPQGKSPTVRSALAMTRTSLRPNTLPQKNDAMKKSGPLKAMPLPQAPIKGLESSAKSGPLKAPPSPVPSTAEEAMPVKPPRIKSPKPRSQDPPDVPKQPEPLVVSSDIEAPKQTVKIKPVPPERKRSPMMINAPSVVKSTDGAVSPPISPSRSAPPTPKKRSPVPSQNASHHIRQPSPPPGQLSPRQPSSISSQPTSPTRQSPKPRYSRPAPEPPKLKSRVADKDSGISSNLTSIDCVSGNNQETSDTPTLLSMEVQSDVTTSSPMDSVFNSSCETVISVEADVVNVTPKEVAEYAYTGEESFHRAHQDIDSLIAHLNCHTSQLSATCSPMKFKQRKDLLVFQSRAFVTDSKLLVSSATQTREKLIIRLNNSMHTLAKIITHTESVLDVLVTVDRATHLRDCVTKMCECYRTTLNAALRAAGKPLAHADMKSLMKQATSLASMLSALMKTLKSLENG